MSARILIIDDEPRWVNFAKNDLSTFDIVVAQDAETALALLEDNQFDLVIASSHRLDVLQTITEKYGKRVIVTTAKPTTQEALAAYRSGAMRYFAKSFGDEYLFNHIREFIPQSSDA